MKVDSICGDWTQLGNEAAAIRHEVFVVEQGVPPELELDEMDGAAVHVLVRDAEGKAIATGRLLLDGHAGRVAVLRACRRNGVGRIVMNTLIKEAARRGMTAICLHAQLSAQGFYENLGFEKVGAIFTEAGIPHIEMRKSILSPNLTDPDLELPVSPP